MTDSALAAFTRKFSDIANRAFLEHIFFNDEVISSLVAREECDRVSKKDVVKALKLLKNSKKILRDDFQVVMPKNVAPKGKNRTKEFENWTQQMEADSDFESDDSEQECPLSDNSTDCKIQGGRKRNVEDCDSKNELKKLKLKLEKAKKKNRKEHGRQIEALMTGIGLTKNSVYSLPTKVENISSQINQMHADIQKILRSLTSSAGVEIGFVNAQALPSYSGKTSVAFKRNNDLITTFSNLLHQVQQRVAEPVSKLQLQRNGTKDASYGQTNLHKSDNLSYLHTCLQVVKDVLLLIDSIFDKGCLRKRKLSLRESGMETEQNVHIFLEDVQITEKPEDDTVPLIISDEVEIISVIFTESSRSISQVNIENPNASSSPVSIMHGKLLVRVDLPYVYEILTDPSWRPRITLFSGDELGVLEKPKFFNLNFRYVFLLRYLLHSYSHIYASFHPNLLDPCYEHPFANNVYENIRERYEPSGKLRP